VREVQPEKPAPGLATPDLVMSRVEVERRGGDSSHDLLVGNDDVGSTSPWRGTGHGAQGRDQARRDKAEWARRAMEHGVARPGMGAPPRGGLGWADGAVSRNERSEELKISIGYRSVDRVDRGNCVDEPVGLIAMLE